MPTSHRPPASAYTITELATEFDITARVIRFYEDLGLLTPGRAGRNRVYAQRDRTRRCANGCSLRRSRCACCWPHSPSW